MTAVERSDRASHRGSDTHVELRCGLVVEMRRLRDITDTSERAIVGR
jgi:hypothetical protein